VTRQKNMLTRARAQWWWWRRWCRWWKFNTKYL